MDNQEIPEMNIKKDSSKKNLSKKSDVPSEKEMEKTKKDLEKIKDIIVKKFKFVKAIGILPNQSIKYFIDEEEIPKDSESKIHLYVIVPDEKIEEIPKMMEYIIPEIEKSKEKQNVWIQIKPLSEIWEICFDSKFELSSAISVAYPLYDTGILSSLRVAEIHKSLVLQKFEKYVVSYVLGGSLIRGDVNEDSDVDSFVIINDTDVKKMSRLELKERLTSIIYQYIGEASALAGISSDKLNVQVYLLTDFWDSVRDANPVMFTFIRDGIPIYDRGTFMPWKALLKMGKLKPSPEAIEMFMRAGEKTKEAVGRRMLDALLDIYWSVITPSQALLMLTGCPPPAPKHIVKEMENAFIKKEKMLERRYINTLDKVVKLYKQLEYKKLKEISGKEIDGILKESEEYLKRLSELRKQIENSESKKIIERVYSDTLKISKTILGRISVEQIPKAFEKELVKTGKVANQHLRILNEIIGVREKSKKGNVDVSEVDKVRRDANTLANALLEYSQRREFACVDKNRMMLEYSNSKKAQLLILSEASFLFYENKIKKISDKAEEVGQEEVSKALEKEKMNEQKKMDLKIFKNVEAIIGKFKIII